MFYIQKIWKTKEIKNADFSIWELWDKIWDRYGVNSCKIIHDWCDWCGWQNNGDRFYGNVEVMTRISKIKELLSFRLPVLLLGHLW